MNILFYSLRWSCKSQSCILFFSAVKEAGHDGVELGFPFTLSNDKKEEIINGLKGHDLAVIGQHWQTIESDFNEHKKVFKKHLYSLAVQAFVY